MARIPCKPESPTILVRAWNGAADGSEVVLERFGEPDVIAVGCDVPPSERRDMGRNSPQSLALTLKSRPFSFVVKIRPICPRTAPPQAYAQLKSRYRPPLSARDARFEERA